MGRGLWGGIAGSWWRYRLHLCHLRCPSSRAFPRETTASPALLHQLSSHQPAAAPAGGCCKHSPEDPHLTKQEAEKKNYCRHKSLLAAAAHHLCTWCCSCCSVWWPGPFHHFQWLQKKKKNPSLNMNLVERIPGCVAFLLGIGTLQEKEIWVFGAPLHSDCSLSLPFEGQSPVPHPRCPSQQPRTDPFSSPPCR